MDSKECRIDSISQSWAIISNAGDNDKKFIALENAENYLVDRENKMIKLFDPPFEKCDINPGYIKDYLPGIRENRRSIYAREYLVYHGRSYFRVWRKGSRIL